MTTPYLALGLTGAQLIELLGSPSLLARWDALPVAFSVLGIDRIDGSSPSVATLDSSAVGAALASRTRDGRFLIAATPQRDHPYNLARRVTSLGHLSAGRSGVLFGVEDGWAPSEPVGPTLSVATAFDAAKAVRALEQSWPFDSIIGDRESGILVQSDQIVHVDHDGAYAIAGPLNAPEPPTGASVVGWYAPGNGESVPADGAPVDLTVGAGGSVLVGTDVVGVLLRSDKRVALSDLFAEADALLDGGLAPVPLGGPLRTAIGLPPARPRTATRSAFPVPQPQVAL